MSFYCNLFNKSCLNCTFFQITWKRLKPHGFNVMFSWHPFQHFRIPYWFITFFWTLFLVFYKMFLFCNQRPNIYHSYNVLSLPPVLAFSITIDWRISERFKYTQQSRIVPNFHHFFIFITFGFVKCCPLSQFH